VVTSREPRPQHVTERGREQELTWSKCRPLQVPSILMPVRGSRVRPIELEVRFCNVSLVDEGDEVQPTSFPKGSGYVEHVTPSALIGVRTDDAGSPPSIAVQIEKSTHLGIQ